MSTRPTLEEAIADSQKLIQVLETYAGSHAECAPLAAEHRTLQADLERCQEDSRQAVDAWRVALARRWDCEVAGRRLYKQTIRHVVECFGEDAPQVALMSRGGAEVNSTPQELYDDLQRLQAGLKLHRASLPFAAATIARLETCAAELLHAIDQARETEHRRRNAVLDSRMVYETFRRAWERTFSCLVAEYGNTLPEVFERLLDVEPAGT